MRTRKIKRFNGIEYAMVARVSPSTSWFSPVKVPSRKTILNPWNQKTFGGATHLWKYELSLTNNEKIMYYVELPNGEVRNFGDDFNAAARFVYDNFDSTK